MKSQVSPNMALLMWLAMARLFQIATGSVQGDIDYLASNMEVRYDVLDNLASESTFLSQITLTNKGQTPIKNGDWVVYFCNIRLMESKHLKHNLAGYVIPGNYGIRLTHVNGCLHKFETTSDFKDIAAGASFTFKFKADHWSVARTDVMPRWYVTAKGLSPQVINNTDDEELTFVGNFDTKEKWKRFVKDVYDPYTPEDRYARHFMSDLETVATKVVPTPVDMNIDTQYHVVVTSDWLIYVQAGLENEAALLKDKLGITVTSTPQKNKVIKLVMGDVSVPGKSGQQLPSTHESYSLEVDADKNVITITGKGLSGVFYGVQTLLGIRTSEGKVPKLTIRDTPRYGYRGMHLDVARNFVPKDRVLKLIDIMAMYKLNKFHFHLTDDEGWRLEIPGLPELTEVGSKRCFDLEDRHCLLSQLGSGPDSTSSGSGSYSVNDYKEILRYANERHVQVIPEFDMPGHGNAAIKSMLARYNKLLAQGDKPGAERYLLNEINDTSQYLSVQYYSDNAINPCMESTYAFVEHVVRSVVNLHNDSQPLTVFHFGGDEVAHGAWMNSSACSNLVERLGLNSSVGKIADQLKDYFVQRISNITANYSLDLAGWEDGLMDVKSTPYDRKLMANREVYGYAWNNIWEWGGGKRAYALANAGYKVVMAQATHLYFDHPYEPDPEERGYYWATRFTDTLKVFGFMPDDLYANIKVERTGAPLAREEFCKTQDACPDLMHKGNVVGIQGHLWTETVRNPDQMFAMIFPRLLALAERAWHKASWEDITDSKKRNETMKADWIRFAGALGNRELVRLDKMGVQYRVPPPGASAEDGKLKTMAIYPGLTVQYSADGLTWKNVTSDTTVKGKIKLRTRSADGSRYSRLVEMEVVATKPTVKGCSPCLMTSNMTKLMATVVVFFLSIWR